MATIRFTNGDEREVPDNVKRTEHGIGWFEGEGDERIEHFVPLSAVQELIVHQPPQKPTWSSGTDAAAAGT